MQNTIYNYPLSFLDHCLLLQPAESIISISNYTVYISRFTKNIVFKRGSHICNHLDVKDLCLKFVVSNVYVNFVERVNVNQLNPGMHVSDNLMSYCVNLLYNTSSALINIKIV